ncbi:ABC transporter permease [Bifidobacterium sp. ESL0763]|uniref:ABC transporter permease n=1 Tax=Bifidobacterium sp. ESL0763 TaxID=2983227 RepID=UPI0023F733E5|nr:ABC transporter permease [Bifidobacterium sp. ESL0763]MDF7663959.1 ABC transporter permease [Bifidobacterium sp. ESL0763]
MGLHQRAEASGLLSFIVCAIVGAGAMWACVSLFPAGLMLSRRLFVACAIIVAACGTVSFIVGYSHRSSSLSPRNRWFAILRRIVEILALATVYASTLFLTAFAALSFAGNLMGPMFHDYLVAICAGAAGVAGYLTFVQAELMDAKTLAGLLPFFVVSGVSVAGLTTDDPDWSRNNFSQLGDRTTFAARMFDSTLILAGVCVVIVSYFAVSELITTYRQRRQWHQDQGPLRSGSRIRHYRLRLTCLSAMLALSGAAFVGIGTFRYTPHPKLHNFSAHGLVVVMGLLLILLPWLAPQLSLAIYVAGYLGIALCAAALVQWLGGANTLTNVEALAGMVFLGWFIVFSRQIAAIEADRVIAQVLHGNAATESDADAESSASATPPRAHAEEIPDTIEIGHRLHSRIAATQ